MTRREDQMSAQPDHAPVTPPYAPAPGARAELLEAARRPARRAGADLADDRRIVAALGATRTPTARAPSRARACCGAFADHCPMAAYERAPAITAEAATSSTATNG
ncbi:hypothetical protein [Streptomyces sp. NPDC058701]|uniref:hypothetical protein n=1 Tax=Streptomyces sp. NPDC058701 TaxID=3346608 RepID=UPI00365665E8